MFLFFVFFILLILLILSKPNFRLRRVLVLVAPRSGGVSGEPLVPSN
jgi:hypothetical protein